MKLSVVVLNYDSGDLLGRCLESVLADPVDFERELLVVDNASRDDSLDRALARAGSGVDRVVRNPCNGGFAYGHNIGMRAARGRYVCLLNPDTLVHPGAFQALVDFLDAHPTAGFVGPKVLGADGHFQRSARRMLPTPFDAMSRALGLSRLFPTSRRLARLHSPWLGEDTTQRVEATTGACMVARREMVEAIGPLDERFFLYCEDVDWFLRARAAGWEVWYHPAAVIEHHEKYSERVRRYRSVADAHVSMIRFHRKHYAADYPAAVNGALYVGVVARMSLQMGMRAAQRWR